MTTIDFNSIESLQENKFLGFKTIRSLMNNDSIIPHTKGVYLILRNKLSKPTFIYPGTGGYCRGKSPNVTKSQLQQEWVNRAITVYIGQAGGGAAKTHLHSGLNHFFRFGKGENMDHWKGRLIWQLADSRNLLVCWKELPDDNPKLVKNQLLLDFETQFSKLPFANFKTLV